MATKLVPGRTYLFCDRNNGMVLGRFVKEENGLVFAGAREVFIEKKPPREHVVFRSDIIGVGEVGFRFSNFEEVNDEELAGKPAKAIRLKVCK